MSVMHYYQAIWKEAEHSLSTIDSHFSHHSPLILINVQKCYTLIGLDVPILLKQYMYVKPKYNANMSLMALAPVLSTNTFSQPCMMKPCNWGYIKSGCNFYTPKTIFFLANTQTKADILHFNYIIHINCSGL